MEDGFAQGDVHAGRHLCGAWGGSSHGSRASHRHGLPVLDRALWLRESQADPHLQDWPKVSVPPAQGNGHSAAQNPQAQMLGTEGMVRVALLLQSVPAVFSPLSAHPCQNVILQTESAHLITARENFRVHLKREVFEWHHHRGPCGAGSRASMFLWGMFLEYLSFSIILFSFLQRTFPRVVQQRLWTSVCSRSCQDQKLISTSDCWGTRNKNLRKCSWEHVSINQSLAGNRNTESKGLI